MTVSTDGQEHRRLVLEWIAKNPGIFALDEPVDGMGAQIAEIASGKIISLAWPEVSASKAGTDTQTGASYVNLLLGDQTQLVLARQGFVFQPDFRNTGPIPMPAPVYCLTDLGFLFSQVENGLQEPNRELVQLLLGAIAIIDGAKVLGMNMSREERRADALLKQLETAQS